MTGTRLIISETFGPTLQGEGPSCGRYAAFVRLSSCNLTCTWCDTPWTWRWSDFDRASEQHPTAVDDVVAWVKTTGARLVVVTGGEPLIQRQGLVELVTGIRGHQAEVEIETNGTIAPPAELLTDGVHFNVSAKLANSGVPGNKRIRGEVLRRFAGSGRARFKFVVRDIAELDEIAELEATYGLAPVWVMPEGSTEEMVLARMKTFADEVIARGWNLTPRLHVLLWGDTRGR